MDSTSTDTQPTPQPQPSTWLDLILYLVVGFGLFLLAVSGVALIFEEVSILASSALYLLNALIFGGTVYVLGVCRGKTSWSEMGFLPPVWRPEWLLVAIAVSIVSIPVRGLVGSIIQFLLEGGLDSLHARSDVLLAGDDFSVVSFLLTLLGAGLLAPISEELYFRGLIHRGLQHRLGFWPRVLLSSAIFGLAHFDSIGVVVSSFVLGLINAIAYEQSESVWLPIAIHVITNTFGVILLYVATAITQLLPSLP
jgi:membrane protease YdiL (CAAX protease family)